MNKVQVGAESLGRRYKCIVQEEDLLGGVPAIRGTRISVAQVLECLAAGVRPSDISTNHPGFTEESVSEVLRFASYCVAARS